MIGDLGKRSRARETDEKSGDRSMVLPSYLMPIRYKFVLVLIPASILYQLNPC